MSALDPIEVFISRWENSGAAERANYQMFLTAKDKQFHDQGLVTLLKQLHDELDAAVLEAYGWGDLAVETQDGKTQDARQEQARDDLLGRLVALDHECAAEEKRGLIRWLRPDYQNPAASRQTCQPPQQADLPGTEASSNQKSKIKNPQSSIHPSSPPPWPDRLPDQVTLIHHLLTTDPTATPDQLSARFGRKNTKRTAQIEGIIETLKGLGQIGC